MALYSIGQIAIHAALNDLVSRDEWHTVIAAVNDWYLDREIIRKVACSPRKLGYGGKPFVDLGSHTSLRAASEMWNWLDQRYVALNPFEEGEPTSALVQLSGGNLATAVTRLHINALPDQLSIYVYAPDGNRDWDDFQAFEFAPRQ